MPLCHAAHGEASVESVAPCYWRKGHIRVCVHMWRVTGELYDRW